MYDVAVVGAGAAGLAAAIFAATGGARVLAIDGAPRIGAKILISGGGRCNVTHDVVRAADFNGSHNAIARVLRSFSVPQTVDWFAAMGVTLKREETGKLFPTSDRARTVLDALLSASEAAGVEFLLNHRVQSVVQTAVAAGSRSSFIVLSASRAIEARQVILATGGQSVPRTGSDGHGFRLARALGHSVTETFPALVPLVVGGDHWIRELSGISAEVELSLRNHQGKIVHRDRGSMLLTHFGVSGPVVLDISRHWIAARKSGPVALLANFLPGESFSSIDHDLVASGRDNPRATAASALRGRLPERVLYAIRDAHGPARPLAQMPRGARQALARDLTELPLPVDRDRGFDYAEVTAGGVPLSEVDLATMQSRLQPGLFLCGEMLEVDGRIGGYNFQWAWASGRLAGLAARKSS